MRGRWTRGDAHAAGIYLGFPRGIIQNSQREGDRRGALRCEHLAFGRPALNVEPDSRGRFKSIGGTVEFFKPGRRIWRDAGGALGIIRVPREVETSEADWRVFVRALIAPARSYCGCNRRDVLIVPIRVSDDGYGSGGDGDKTDGG